MNQEGGYSKELLTKLQFHMELYKFTERKAEVFSMKRTKKILIIALSSLMLIGTTIITNAATVAWTNPCPVGDCSMANIPSQLKTGTCRFHGCGKVVDKYVCSRCGTIYYTCRGGHVQ